MKYDFLSMAVLCLGEIGIPMISPILRRVAFLIVQLLPGLYRVGVSKRLLDIFLSNESKVMVLTLLLSTLSLVSSVLGINMGLCLVVIVV